MKSKAIISKVRQVITAPYRFFMTGMITAYAGVLAIAPTYCATIKPELDADGLFGSMAEILIKIAFYVGALIAISGLFTLLLAYKDDNGATRSAVKSCSVCLA